MIPENAPKIKYNVPMSLWFVEKNQRLTNVEKVLLLTKIIDIRFYFLIDNKTIHN